MQKIYEFKSAALQFGDIDKRQGIVTGYFSQFNNIDSQKDIIRKGAFARTIQETGPQAKKPRIKHLLNHNIYQAIGLLTVLKEDDYGLYYESQIGTHNQGQDFLKMVESGLITEHSIGYEVIAKAKNPPTGVARELTEVKLYEGSCLTGWGVNEGTPLLSLKMEAGLCVNEEGQLVDLEENLSQRIKSLEKFCRNTDATDDTIELLLIEIKQLQQQILNLSAISIPSAEKASEPQTGAEVKSEQGYNADEVLTLINIQRSRLKFN